MQKTARRLNFGEVLRALRLQQKLDLADLAELVGWEVKDVEIVERYGGKFVSEAEALELARALDVDPQLLTVAVHQ